MSAARHRAYHLELAAQFHLAGVPHVRRAGPADVVMELATREEVADAWGDAEGRTVWETRFADGRRFTVWLGGDGDYLMHYGDECAFFLSADGQRLLCAPTDEADPAWRRVLLDTVLFSASLLRGNEALHASAVVGQDGAVGFLGVSGGGKTSLAATLVTRGHPLLADDVVVIDGDADGLRAHPAPPVMNLPTTLTSSLPALGPLLGHFEEEDEDWVAVDHACTEAVPLATLILVSRHADGPTRVQPGRAHPFDLLPFMIFYPHLTGRHRTRFELVSDIVTGVPIFHLRAGPEASVDELASLVEGHL